MSDSMFDEEATKRALKDDLAYGIRTATLIDAHMQDVKALATVLVRAGWRKP